MEARFRPDILRRKRAQPEAALNSNNSSKRESRKRFQDSSDDATSFLTAGSSASGPSDVEEFYKHIAAIRASEPVNKKRKGTQRLGDQEEERVRERLAKRGECQLDSLRCTIGRCTRSFQSVRVLAWHMSYAHADTGSDQDCHAQCYVCGQKMKSVKGKNSHLITAHKDLCMLHNAQCIQQRLPSSSAPLKKRGAPQQRTVHESRSRKHPDGYFLDDELSYDEDSDYEEDVSVDAPPVFGRQSFARTEQSFIVPASTHESLLGTSGKGCVVKVEARVGGGIIARGLKHRRMEQELVLGTQDDSDQFVVVDDDDSALIQPGTGITVKKGLNL